MKNEAEVAPSPSSATNLHGFGAVQLHKSSLCAALTHSTPADGKRRAILAESFAASAAERCGLGPVPGRHQRRWGVVQPIGHLTVNEDGEGSNPSAPANSPL